MGLSIHYSGRIANPDLLPELIEEIEDIAKVYNWKYFVFDRRFPKNTFGKPFYNKEKIYGICFTPSDCETVPVCFLSNGRMSDYPHLKFFGTTEIDAEKEYLYMLSVKTQYAGIEMHQFIIQLFRHLNKKYFTEFKMTDEGSYWETNDEELLKLNFKKYTDLIEGFVSAIESYPMRKAENIESYFRRLLQQIKDKRREE